MRSEGLFVPHDPNVRNLLAFALANIETHFDAATAWCVIGGCVDLHIVKPLLPVFSHDAPSGDAYPFRRI